MTDKKKIKAEIERLKRDVYKSDAFNGQTRFALDRVTDFINSLPEEPKIDLKEESDIYNALAKFIGSFSKRDFDIAKHFYELGHTEEPVSEELEDYINELSKQFQEVSFAKLSRIAVRVAKWQKEHLWKPVDGNDLPEYEREVVVFTQDFPDNAGMMMVSIGHRPTPEGFDGRSLTTGKVEHYTPKTYDKGGWNIPNIVYWLDVNLPKEIEL